MTARRVSRTAILIGIAVTSVAASADPGRFELSGAATLQRDAPPQQSATLQLKAYLVPSDGAIPTTSLTSESAHFTLASTLSAAPLVCYNDTIFRDDFDGDGG